MAYIPSHLKTFAALILCGLLGLSWVSSSPAQKTGGSSPFRGRVDLPELPQGMEWFNTKKSITKADLKGKFVLFDFWTYCCINCMHILPELKKLEREFPNNLVVIGVHSAKFDAEQVTENIRDAILRYEIEIGRAHV